MSVTSSIEWTDTTWNPVRGCTKISPGFAHCYAETFAERFRGVPGHPYEQGFDWRLVPQKLSEPLKWRPPRMIFVNSMSDLQVGPRLVTRPDPLDISPPFVSTVKESPSNRWKVRPLGSLAVANRDELV